MSEATKVLSPRQRQTLAGRLALAGRCSSEEEKLAYYRRLGQRSAAAGITLSDTEAAALVDAHALLGGIAERAQQQFGRGVIETDI